MSGFSAHWTVTPQNLKIAGETGSKFQSVKMAKVRKRQWTANGETKFAYTVDYVDQYGNRERKQFTTKKFADAFRIETESKLQNGVYRPDAMKVTIGEIADNFLTHCKERKDRNERMTEKMYRVYDGHIKNYICPDPTRHKGKRRPSRLVTAFPPSSGLAHFKAGALTTGGVGEFRDNLRSAGVGVVTTRKILATLQCMLKFAIGKDQLSLNVAEDVEVIGPRNEDAKKIVPPTPQAMKTLLEIAGDFRTPLLVASSTAVRAGEFHALRWRHFDFELAEVRIETRVDAFGEEGTTKTAAGIRTIPIAQAVIVALKEWKLKSKFNMADDLVFPNALGEYESHDNMVKREYLTLFDDLDRLHKEDAEKHQKIPYFNWHALRHFGISMWIKANLNPKTIQTFAGHSSLQVTMDRYGHIFTGEDHRKAMDLIAQEMAS